MDVRIVDVAPRPLAAVSAEAPLSTVGPALIAGLDKVYTSLRARGVSGLGHNVAVYHGIVGKNGGARLKMIAGVETPGALPDDGEVIAAETPAGRAAVFTHVGPYAGIRQTGDAVREWLRARGHDDDNLSWEVYGDWSDDPAKLTTDLYFLIAEKAGS